MSAGSYTRDWAEGSPLDHTTFGAQPGHVREKTVDVAERLKSFFYGFTAGETTKGGKYLEFCVQGTAPSSAADAIMLYCKDVTSKGELHAKDEDGDEIQITAGGKLNGQALDGLSAAALTAALNAIYPVGIVVTLGVATNPGTLFGVGTWTAIAGKVIVGIDSTQTEFDTLDETGGAKTVTLTSAQSGLPAHTHLMGGGFGRYDGDSGTGMSAQITNTATAANSAANASEAHTNLQPYIVKYVWQRTA